MINLWSFWTHACTHTHTYTNTHIREISLKTSSLELGDSILFSFPIWSASSCHEAQDINDVNTRELICTQSSTFIQWHQALQLDSALQHSEFMSQNLGKTSHKKNSHCWIVIVLSDRQKSSVTSDTLAHTYQQNETKVWCLLLHVVHLEVPIIKSIQESDSPWSIATVGPFPQWHTGHCMYWMCWPAHQMPVVGHLKYSKWNNYTFRYFVRSVHTYI